MENNFKMCNFQSSTLIDGSDPKPFLNLKKRLRKRFLMLRNKIYDKIAPLYVPLKNTIFKKSSTLSSQLMIDNKTTYIKSSSSPVINLLNLHPGEWVEIKSYDEILLTLDKNMKHKGLAFTPDMAKFCGGSFKVFNKINIIRLESTGEIRKIKIPTVILEGVHCDGKYWDGCDRACFHFWREVWLKRIPDN